jgi:hypothetical protein
VAASRAVTAEAPQCDEAGGAESEEGKRPSGLPQTVTLCLDRKASLIWIMSWPIMEATALWTHKGRRTASCGAGKGKGLLIACASGHAGKRNICCIDIVVVSYK